MIKGQEKMRRIVRLGALAAVMWVAAAPVFGSCATVGLETVCGRVEGFTGDCSGPGTTCNAGSGFIGVFGFAMASTPVERIEILIESVQFPGDVITLGRATYGEVNPDATDLYPGFPDSALPGWSYNINSPLFGNGLYDVWVRVVTSGGVTKELDPQQVLFTNNDTVLRPFGEIERPGQNEDVFGTCDTFTVGNGVCEVGLGENCLNSPYLAAFPAAGGDCVGLEFGHPDDLFCCGFDAGPTSIGCDEDAGTNRCQVDDMGTPWPDQLGNDLACNDDEKIRYTVVSGWALDLGITGEDTGIAWVELETNGALFGNTRTSCEFDRRLGGLTNCYGLPRIDLENRFPFAFDAPSAGYRFVLDVGAMLNADLVTHGSNEIIVRAGDWSNQFEDIDRKSVNFLCAEDFSEPAFGEVEAPRPGRLYTGDLTFQGWALDGEGVETIDIYVDGLLIATLTEGAAVDAMGSPIPGGFAFDTDDPDFDPPGGFGTRPLVAADYPGFQDSDAPVWQLTDYDTTLLNNGFHTLQVRVTDDEGDSNFIGGEVTFRVDNTSFAILGLYKSP